MAGRTIMSYKRISKNLHRGLGQQRHIVAVSQGLTVLFRVSSFRCSNTNPQTLGLSHIEKTSGTVQRKKGCVCSQENNIHNLCPSQENRVF